MSRRVFPQSLTALLGGFVLSVMTQTKPDSPFKSLEADWKILQISPVAGFQYTRVKRYDRNSLPASRSR